MDTLITYDEAVALVANPPTLAPHPNFMNLGALRCHLQCALQRLILDVNGDPELDATGNPTYVPVPALDRATQASIDANFLGEKNYWLSYKNIKQTCYSVLDETIDDVFKFSPDPNLTGWNPSMEIIKIMEQMTTTYGRPTPTALLQNDMLF